MALISDEYSYIAHYWQGTTDDDTLSYSGGDDFINGRGGNDVLIINTSQENVVSYTNQEKLTYLIYKKDSNSTFYITVYDVEAISFIDGSLSLEEGPKNFTWIYTDDYSSISHSRSGSSDNDFFNFIGGTDTIDGDLGNDAVSLHAFSSEVSTSKNSGITYLNFDNHTLYGDGTLILTNIEKVFFRDGELDISDLSLSLIDVFAPNISGPSGSSGDPSSEISIDENTSNVYTFSANETVTWSLNGGIDASKFSINNSTGALSFSFAPDYESPTDSDSNNTYVVVVRATDSSSNISEQTLTVTVNQIDEIKPFITGPSGSSGDSFSEISIDENTSNVYTFSANETVTWSLGNDYDSSLFSIDLSGVLNFAVAPNFESPLDNDTNNEYIVNVKATDSSGNKSSQLVTVSIKDLLDKDNFSKSPYHLRNWENLSSGETAYIDYERDTKWIYENLSTDKVRWTVWDGGYDGTNTIARNNLEVLQLDATDEEITFLQNTFNELDKYIELDFKQVDWTEQAEIVIWLVDDIPSGVHGFALLNNIQKYGSVEAVIDVTDEIGGNYTKHTMIHEIAHCLGLSHPGINGIDTPYWDLYNTSETIMSYVDDNGEWGTSFTELDIQALRSIWGAEGSYGEIFNIDNNSPAMGKQIISHQEIGSEYELHGIADYDGNIHASSLASDEVKNSYKFQGRLDVNNDGTYEAIYTNKASGRWVTASIDSLTDEVNFHNHGKGGTTRIVGIYIDPLVASGDVIKNSDHDSQRRFQNDLSIDNLIAKKSGDYNGDGDQEVYWKTNDGTAYLRALMHSDGNIQYANYQSELQMTEYLTSFGFSSEAQDLIGAGSSS